MEVVNDFRLKLRTSEYVPIITGGMGVHFSSPELALEVCRLGGVGHISDAMSPLVSDLRYGTDFTRRKLEANKPSAETLDKSNVKFNLEDLHRAQMNHVAKTMDRKSGRGAIFINIMEKLGMGDPVATLRTRLHGALDGGIDGITLAAGLHCQSLKLMEDHPRFNHALIGIIVSSCRALKIFLRGAERTGRLPDYVIVEGPLAGGHLGFGEDWRNYQLKEIVAEIVAFVKEEKLNIPVIAAGGIFTGSDAVEFLKMGAAGVQVATRFTVTKECGVPEAIKQKYFGAEERDVVVNCASPTGYLMRMLSFSPCLKSNVTPNCEAFGYILNKEGKCQYLEAFANTPCDASGKKGIVEGKVCLCSHFSKSSCYTCGHNVFRLKQTSLKRPDGGYQLLSTEHVFKDYQYSKDHQILLPVRDEIPAAEPESQVIKVQTGATF